MKRASLLRLLLLALLLTALWWFGGSSLPSGRRSAEAAAGQAGANEAPGSAATGEPGPTLATRRGDKARDPAAKEAWDWANRGGTIDGAQPDVTRSLVRATVPAGHAMVTGGHLLPDGTREFAMITPKWMELPNGGRMVEMEVELLHFDAAGVAGAGLDTLVTGDRKSEQNAEVWTPEEVARTMATVAEEAAQAKPRVVTSPGAPGRIQMGAGREVRFELELSASEAADGGFDLTSDLKRADPASAPPREAGGAAR